MAPIMIEDNGIIITRPVSNSNSFLVIEALHSYTNYPYLQMNVSKTPIILTLDNSY
jgi:hypothetical protein